jgi:N-acyl-D-amino-acid deacylase
MSPKLDVVLSGGHVVDGTGAPRFDGAVGLLGDRIAWVGHDDQPAPESERTIDVVGAVICPGFVDVHNHSDLSPLILPTMPSTIRQGVTTVVVGNCGASPWPMSSFDEGVRLAYGEPGSVERPSWDEFGDYLGAIDEARPGVNIATLIGHGSVRLEVMGLEPRPPTPEELEAMRRLIVSSIDAGAVGLSSGLVYVPGMFAGTGELVELARAAGRAGGLYASHIRGEGEHLFRAVDEAIEVGRRAELPVHVSHLKCESSSMWGRADALLERIHAAEDVSGDQYPYAAWNSSLSSLLPPWAPVEEVGDLAVRPNHRARLRSAVEQGEGEFQSSVNGVGWDRIVIVSTKDRRWHGRDVATIGREMGFEPFAAFVRLLVEDPDTSCIGHAMHEDDVRRIVADREVFVASDASATAPDGPGRHLPVHPREYGTFPRVLTRYVREQRALTLEESIRKMTSLPADRFGIRDRGRITEGFFADLVVFDPASIADEATFELPHVFPSGIAAVVVNGCVAYEAENETIQREGRLLRRA